MNIQQLGVRITGVPGIQSIEVTAHGSIVIDCDFTYSESDGKIVPQAYGLPEARELRDALTAAIEHAERMSAPAGVTEAQVFTVGQELTGNEDLPIGTVIRDTDDDMWHLCPNGRWSLNPRNPNATEHLESVVSGFSPVKIARLP